MHVLLFEKRIEDILKPKPNQPQQVEQIDWILELIGDICHESYLGTSPNPDAKNGEEYAYSGEVVNLVQDPRIKKEIQTLIKNAHTEGKLDGAIEELEQIIKPDKWAFKKGLVLVAYRYAEDRLATLKAKRQSDG